MSDSSPKTLTTGTYLVEAACPRCGVLEEILVRLSSVLTSPEDDLGSHRVKLKAKAREHDCKQGRLTQLKIEGGETK